MKDDILNILNLEELTKVRNSISGTVNVPAKNSIVSLVPLEFVEKGVKVLINGRLFFAIIKEKIPLKEEIIALVTSDSPFTLSLNFSSVLRNNKVKVLNELLRKLKLKNDAETNNLLLNVIKEEKPIISSNIALLNNLLRKLNVSGLELSLLINLVWGNNQNNYLLIQNLFEDLFDESFDTICAKLFSTIEKILFENISPIILHQINSDLIFNEEDNNTQVITNKSENLLKIIKSIGEIYKSSRSDLLNDFIKHASTYILQKSVLKDYDYYPDFVIARYNDKLNLIKFNIKKTFSIENQPVYKLQFKNENLPFELTGIIRNGYLFGNIETEDTSYDQLSNEIDEFKKSLEDKIKVSSSLNINSSKTNLDEYKHGINKLIS